MLYSSDIKPINAAERFLIRHLADAEPVKFQMNAPARERTIRAILLRHLLLVPGRVPCAGLHLRNARIEGKFDLRDLVPSTPGLPALSFEGCEFTGELDFCFARINRLSVARSSFSRLCLREADVDGPLDISGVRPPPGNAADSTCWIDARDCIINGELNASGAQLRAPAPPDRRPSSFQLRYALWLRNAVIKGSVHLVDDFTAEGGVSLDTAHVRGNVWARGAVLTAWEENAFNAQNAHIGGGLVMDKGRDTRRFHARGRVWLLGVHIGDRLQLDGAMLDAEHPGPSWNAPGEALQGSSMDIGTNIRMPDARVAGRVQLTGSHIRGLLDCSSAKFRNQPGGQPALRAAGVRIDGNALFKGAVVARGIDLTGATIGGDLNCDGANLTNPGATAFCAKNATIRQDAAFGLCAEGMIDLTGATISGTMAFSRATLQNQGGGGKDAAVRATRVKISGSVDFDQETIVRGEIDLSAASIGGNLNCLNTTLVNPARSAIYAKDLRVGGDLRLMEGTRISGDVQLERACVTGRLHWRDVWLDSDPSVRNDTATILNLKHSQVGAVLEAERLNIGREVLLDLGGASVALLECVWPDGWGVNVDGPDVIASRDPINVDGLTYERIVFKPDATGGGQSDQIGDREKWLGVALASWLKRQDRRLPNASFFPQPYRQLARVLRIQGDEDVARVIAVAEWDERLGQRSREPQAFSGIHQAWNAFLRRLRVRLGKAYGFFFGYGLKPRRAFLTLAAYAGLGMAGVWFAQSRQMLIERPLPVATVASVEQEPKITSASPGSASQTATDVKGPDPAAATTTLARPTIPGVGTAVASSASTDPAARETHPVTDQQPATTTVSNKPHQLPLGERRVLVIGNQVDPFVADIACTDAAVTGWDALVYAVDMILPFIPLHQETKCEIRSDDKIEPIIWRVLRDVYTIVGWLVSSLALLTVSGILRRSDESSG